MRIEGADLDHVAVAVERWPDAWGPLVEKLGGRWMSGGRGPGFAPSQLGYANGMRVEVLQPHDVEHNDFLRRFLDRNGPGPHHFTFKLPDIHAALSASERAGYHPVNVDLSDPTWQEAFLHPKEACGVVVQLAYAGEGDWRSPAPSAFPTPVPQQATLVRIAHAVADLDAAQRLFRDLLGGRQTDAGGDESARWVELAWPGAGRIRLLSPASPASPLAAWLGGRPGRVHHVAFSGFDDAATEGAVELADGSWEVPPSDELGTRLLLLR
jgi:methylmalonyl-CoA/ethylmalonyl-CoA epimerase